MKIKEYLKQLKDLDLLIKHKKEQLKTLWSSATYSGVSYEIRVQSSRNNKSNLDVICKIIELEQEIELLTAELKSRQEELKEAARHLENKEETKIIILRYIDFRPWDEITEEMHYSKRWVLILHKKALSKISILLDFTL